MGQRPWERGLYQRAYRANHTYPGTLTVADVAAIIERDGRVCYWCRKPDLEGRDLTIDHLERRNDPAVIVVACRLCNDAKLALCLSDEPLPAYDPPRWNQERFDKRMDEPEVPLIRSAW